MTYEEFISHFKIKKRGRDSVQCICPAHNDKEASLTISKGKKGIVLHCHADCETSEILEATGLKMGDLTNYEKPGSESVCCMTVKNWMKLLIHG